VGLSAPTDRDETSFIDSSNQRIAGRRAMIPSTETAMREHEAMGMTVKEVAARGHLISFNRTKPIAKMAPDVSAPNEANLQNGT
jgi:hypothetical protein